MLIFSPSKPKNLVSHFSDLLPTYIRVLKTPSVLVENHENYQTATGHLSRNFPFEYDEKSQKSYWYNWYLKFRMVIATLINKLYVIAFISYFHSFYDVSRHSICMYYFVSAPINVESYYEKERVHYKSESLIFLFSSFSIKRFIMIDNTWSYWKWEHSADLLTYLFIVRYIQYTIHYFRRSVRTFYSSSICTSTFFWISTFFTHTLNTRCREDFDINASLLSFVAYWMYLALIFLIIKSIPMNDCVSFTLRVRSYIFSCFTLKSENYVDLYALRCHT